MADDRDRGSPPRRDGERPDYRVYRSRPRWLKGLGRTGEPGFEGLREERDRAGQRRLPPLTWQRVVKWLLLGILVWVVLSLVLFMISAELERGKVSQEAKTALDHGGFTVTSTSNILVLGSDARPARARDCPQGGCGPARSDTIMLLRAGPGHSAKLSIPRDTVVDIPGHGRDKINAAYAIGGPALTITTVKNYLGVQINHLVEVNFDNFPEFIDSLGGINVTTGCVLSNINGGTRNGGFTLDLKPGEHHLDGKEALAYARTRVNECPGAADNDLTRASHQQDIFKGIKHRLVSPFTFFRLPLASWQAPKAIRTDMSGPSLLGLFATIATTGSPPPRVLKPSRGEVLANGGSGLVVSEDEKRAEVRRFLAG
jgi:LCP family protein required for cell wall assembly